MFGYHGRYLRIDVSTGQTQTVRLTESVLRRFIGGVGLGAWLLLQEWPDGFEEVKGLASLGSGWYGAMEAALDPHAPLICAFSPLVGSPLTTSAKFALVACSPLTGRFNDALCGSHFALAGKRTGYDALVIRGQAERLAVVLIDEAEVRILPAEQLRGLTISQTEQALRDWFGHDWSFLVIGPAGEKCVRFANVSHGSRHAGRGGLGAVLGAKHIKAIGVRGRQTVQFAHSRALADYGRELSRKSFSPATEKYRELGTIANLLVFDRLGVLPHCNFQAAAAADELSRQSQLENGAEILAESLEVHKNESRKIRQGCVACTIGCEHLYAAEEPVRLEYETVFALGPMCGLYDGESVVRLARLCDELGLDTISTGGTLAWAMECAERGQLLGLDLRFGDPLAMERWIKKIASREGMGNLLAEGSRWAAKQLGLESSAMHCKGLELPGYDVRRLPHLALGLAVAGRGADHNRSSAYDADFSCEGQSDLSPESWARRVVESENQAALLDSLILCKFLRRVVTDWFEEAARMLLLVTGWEVSAQELRQTAERIINAKKLFNQRVGWQETEDMLPERLFEQSAGGGTFLDVTKKEYRTNSQARPVLRLDQFQAARTAYYRLRGWDDAGRLSEMQAAEVLKD